MTVENTTNKKRFLGDGSTDEVTFNFRALSASDIKVYVYPEDLDFDDLEDYLQTGGGVDYDVTLEADGEGGTVTFTTAPTAAEVGLIVNVLGLTQTADLPTEGNFNEEALETALDRLVMQNIQQQEEITRSIQLRREDPLADDDFAGFFIEAVEAADRASCLLKFSATGDGIEVGPSVTEFEDATTSAEAAAVTAAAQAALAATARAGAETAEANAETAEANAEAAQAAAEAAAAAVNLPTLGAAHTLLQVNTAGNALEYGLLDVNNLKAGFIAEATAGTVATDDILLFADATSSNVTRRDTVANLLALVSSSGWVPIKTVTASASATIDFVNGSGGVVLDGTYKIYAVVMDTIIPATDNVDFYVRTSTNAGSSYDAGASDYTSSSGGSATFGYVNASGALGNGTGENFNAILYLYNPSGTAKYKVMSVISSALTATPAVVSGQNTVVRNATADVDAIRFLMSSGNITSGTFTLYGLKGAP